MSLGHDVKPARSCLSTMEGRPVVAAALPSEGAHAHSTQLQSTAIQGEKLWKGDFNRSRLCGPLC